MRGFKAGVATAALLAVLLATSPPGHGTSFNPLTADECPPEAALSAGATVYLFHSGAEGTLPSTRTGDILVAASSRGIGRIRVDAAAGALCFRGVVLEGELHQHDVARAGSFYYLVIVTDTPCRLEAGR